MNRRFCKCGRRLGPRGKDPLCYGCRKVKYAAARARCQAERCELPVREGTRMCGIHLPRFEFLDVPTLEEAATMGWGTWIV